ncbi:tyrosine-type recombinase/integrase [Spongisporangium articulatum]|uniref:Tyrosine-type recombinase/integrase n=1 Tax=Spongisporangium articulatum TaxID=3362603 RepID=A0ABW8AMZ9_9ACTN
MPSKRRFGRVRKLPSGRWQARYLGPDGIDRPAPETFSNKTDATIWLADQEAELRVGDWRDPAAGETLLGEYASTWIEERPGLRPRTVELYESLLRLHIAPSLGRLPLREVTAPRVRTWRADLLAADVGPVTVAKAYRLLKAVMATAADDDIIRRNPCRIPGAGVEPIAERPTATLPEVFALADAVGERYRALVLVATFTGLRFGEAMGLRRKHIDLEARTLRVEVVVTEIGGQQVEGPPKSGAGVRTVTLPAAVVPDLRRHLDDFAQPGQEGRVFVGPKGATPRRSNWHVLWSKATIKVGVEGLHFHDLRHTGNTMAAATGASLRELMTRMGHGSTRAALIYQHASQDRDRAIADALDVVLDKHHQAAKQARTPNRSGTQRARNAQTKRGDGRPSAGTNR